jgi:hypothetical protein
MIVPLPSALANTNVPHLATMSVDNAKISTFHDNAPPPCVGAVMKMLPPDTWLASTPTSLRYFAVDVSAVVSSMLFLHVVVSSNAYRSLSPIPGQVALVLTLQVLVGFAMWCMWCVGHEARHGTISKESEYGRAVN